MGQPSLYLSQHARNPIDWYPWAEEALARASRESKPIFLSVGYSSCHWCHVMEREVFEKDDVARFMNDRFVSIKVDREERPDIDAVFMEAVMALNGSGGWPMSVFLTPDLRPFHGGTYYSHAAFLATTKAIDRAFQNRRDIIEEQARALYEHVSRIPTMGHDDPAREDLVNSTATSLLTSCDLAWGGLAGSMKFPTPMAWMFLLDWWHRTRDPGAERAIRVTLDAMSSGGIHDHLAGGFHRYTVESRWIVPHFEKMLYDNALMAILFTRASTLLKEPRYAEVARSTLDFMLEGMSGPGGGFFSSIDADSGGQEGAFYVWTPGQIEAITGDDAPAICRLLGVTEQGNFDGSNVLTRRTSPGVDGRLLIEKWRPALLRAREFRTPPTLDRKVITAWNGLAIVAMARGHAAMGHARHRKAAEAAAGYILSRHRSEDGRLLRSSTDGVTSGPGVLQDHANMAWALAELHDATKDASYMTEAQRMVDLCVRDFGHPVAAFHHTPVPDSRGLPRQILLSDGARPSGNSAMLHALLVLSRITGRSDYRTTLMRTLSGLGREMVARGIDMCFSWDAALLALDRT